MTSSIILTHCGKMGDFFYCLPIASWLAKEWGVTIKWALAEAFLAFHYMEPLLKRLPFTESVTLTPNPVRDFEAGGQPYHFNPADYGLDGVYFNLGIRRYPDTFMTAYCAGEHGLGWDQEFTLDLGEVEPTDKILRGEQVEIAGMVPQSEAYPIPMDLLELGRMLKAAKERHLWYSGPATMLYMARIPFNLYWEKGHPRRNLYLNEQYFGGSLITPVEFVRR